MESVKGEMSEESVRWSDFGNLIASDPGEEKLPG